MKNGKILLATLVAIALFLVIVWDVLSPAPHILSCPLVGRINYGKYFDAKEEKNETIVNKIEKLVNGLTNWPRSDYKIFLYARYDGQNLKNKCIIARWVPRYDRYQNGDEILKKLTSIDNTVYVYYVGNKHDFLNTKEVRFDGDLSFFVIYSKRLDKPVGAYGPIKLWMSEELHANK